LSSLGTGPNGSLWGEAAVRIEILGACGAASYPEAFAAMPRRIAYMSLLCAWLCASGAMLDVAQGVAWVRMFAGYAGRESVAAAARDTFDPARPCAICRAVSKARDAACQHCPAAPASGSEKMVMIFQTAETFVAAADEAQWPLSARVRATVRTSDVPLPPPKTSLAS
jgi:hypothetical protein